ncbi:VOC family protein [Thalassotalea sp. HSM 43]|uniref:VOC family protein n=1 Tax=Thalassotalea sp. HSM 43 TaxID=2552945 RepID=UPI001080EB69|nr:VOC family protein [Thalassotalea sp. HSM 43]QBY05648.1 VOC family protein [Thalassotalea sp. HSM 43]
MSVKAIPEGFHSITPYLVCNGAEKAVEFYQHAFNAQLVLRLDMPDGRIAHAEIKIGDSHIMLTNEHPEMGFVSPETLGGAGVSLMLYGDDCDAMFAQAISAGATELRPLTDQFYGDRTATVKDPFGHVWTIGTHKEDLTQQQLEQRMAEFMSNFQQH